MARTPHPVSDNSSPEAPLPFCGDQDKEPNPLLAQYEQLCPDELHKGAVDEVVAERLLFQIQNSINFMVGLHIFFNAETNDSPQRASTTRPGEGK